EPLPPRWGKDSEAYRRQAVSAAWMGVTARRWWPRSTPFQLRLGPASQTQVSVSFPHQGGRHLLPTAYCLLPTACCLPPPPQTSHSLASVGRISTTTSPACSAFASASQNPRATPSRYTRSPRPPVASSSIDLPISSGSTSRSTGCTLPLTVARSAR